MTDPNIQYRELAINPPVISFSSLRNFDWGPVTIPIQTDGTVHSQRANSSFSYLETPVWFLFDDNALISQYDITFRRLEWAVDYVKPFLKPQLVQELGSAADDCEDVDKLMHLRAAIDICQQHEIYCLGSDQQYESTQACIDYIYRKTPMGKVYQWGGDSGKRYFLILAAFSTHKTTMRIQPCADIFISVCNAWNQPSALSAHSSLAMIKYRPNVHCPHVGYAIINAFSSDTNIYHSPSGGGMCIQRDVCASSFLA